MAEQLVIGHGVKYEKQLMIVLCNGVLNKGKVVTLLESKCWFFGDKEE